MANWEPLQTPLVPVYEYRRTTDDSALITVAPAGTSLYNTTANHRVIVGTRQYRANLKGQLTIPTADAALVNARIASGDIRTLSLVGSTPAP